MTARHLLVATTLVAIGTFAQMAVAQTSSFPRYERLGKYRAAGENPYYHVNRYGYGNYVLGPNGSIGGYTAGSGGARQLEILQELKCRSLPESC